MSTVSLKIPRVNLVSIVSGVVGLVSLTLSWWGVNSFGTTLQWGLFTHPSQSGFFDSTSFDQALGFYSLVVILFALVSTATEILGSFDKAEMFLGAGLAGSVLTLISFPIIVAAALSSAETGSSCQASGSCITGAFGSTSGVNWGFQIGYYLFIVSSLLLVGAIVVHKIFVQRTLVTSRQISTAVQYTSQKFCIDCGGPLPLSAKFCPNCAHPTVKA